MHSEAPPNVYSGNYGTEIFPLHTDLAHWSVPPRYLVLRCRVGTTDVTTRLVDGEALAAAFGEAALRRTLVRPRRPVQGKLCLLRVIDYPMPRVRCIRWDSLFVEPASHLSAQRIDALQTWLSAVVPRDVILERTGDTLIIDNWRMLHGRSAVGISPRHRKIERVYLKELHG